MKRRDLLLGIAAGIAQGGIPTRTSAAQTPVSGGFAHPEWFATPAWLQERASDEQLVIVAFTPAEDFAGGHIPEAVQLDWPALELAATDEASIATWQADIQVLLTSLGIDQGSSVVVYDGGTFWAARLWWVLVFLGHERVRVLDGGLQAWTAGGGAPEHGSAAGNAAASPYVGEQNPNVIVTIDAAVAAADQMSAVFVDARTAGEYAVGHIPGAVNIPFLDNAVDGTAKYWKSPDDLRMMYQAAGVTPDKQVIPYCSSGVRSAVTHFTLRQLGYEHVGLFTGSFAEWTSDPTRPVER